MNKFSARSSEIELLDAPTIPKNLLFRNLKELNVVNRFLGGHRITLNGIEKLLNDKSKIYKIADIGCGGGDSLKYIAQWANKNNFKVNLIGIDINKEALGYLKQNCADYPNIEGVEMDYKNYVNESNSIDIIHCSLFCHHLADDELFTLFTFLKKNVQVGFVINDLQRHWFAYYSIKFLTFLFNGSSLVKNDAPLSVLRSFHKKELALLLSKAKIKNHTIQWMWAFRYLVIWKKK